MKALYFTEAKTSKSTLVIAPDDLIVDVGKGEIDLFEWLKFNISGMYKQQNPPNYFDRYFCFEKNSKFKPE